jgi:DNA-binding NarL/FixJ family response regulator
MAEAGIAGHLERAAVDALLAAAESRPISAADDRPARLSEREMTVLRLVARGQSDKHIARVLGISPKTVADYVQHVYDKIGVRSRAGAALFAVEQGLLH